MVSGWLKDVKRFFDVFSLLSDLSDEPKCTFIRTKSQTREDNDPKSKVERYFSTSYGVREAVEKGLDRWAVSERKATLNV